MLTLSCFVVELSPIHERVRSLVGVKTYRTVADMTGYNAETVRRYMLGQEMSVDFLASLARATNASAEWLLTGRGPMKRTGVQAHALQEASVSELLNAMARTLERLAARVERLESYAQTLETRVRAVEGVPGVNGHASLTHSKSQDDSKTREADGRQATDQGASLGASQGREGDDAEQSIADLRVRVQRIADAAAQRPRPDAR